MSVLNEIKNKLEKLAQGPEVKMNGVWYGACQVDRLDEWNYFVFNRAKTSKSSNRCDYQTFYQIHVIHEDYIPEGYVQKVIEAIEKPGTYKLKATGDPIQYDYTFKGNTNMVVEIATIDIYRPEKRC